MLNSIKQYFIYNNSHRVILVKTLSYIFFIALLTLVIPFANGEEGNTEWTDWREDTEIKVSIVGNSVIDLDSQNRLIRAYVEVINFDPGDGYYFMHIIQPTTNKTIAEQEIAIKEKGNGEAGANVAYLIHDEEILENGLPLQGDYEILISTESGDAQGSTSFSIIESSNPTLESIEEKISEKTESNENESEFVSETQIQSEEKSIVEEEPDSIIEEATKIPDWIRNIFVLYADGSISDQELINAITFLIEQKIIEI